MNKKEFWERAYHRKFVESKGGSNKSKVWPYKEFILAPQAQIGPSFSGELKIIMAGVVNTSEGTWANLCLWSLGQFVLVELKKTQYVPMLDCNIQALSQVLN